MMPTLPEILSQSEHGRAVGRLYNLPVSVGTRNGASTPYSGRHSWRRYGFAIVGILFLVLLLAVLALPAQAQESATAPTTVTDDQVNAIAKKLFCPVCENITLDTCGTAACADWRYEIRLQLEAGMTEQQIVEDFVHRFGDRVVGTPLDPLLRAVSLVTPWLIIAAALIAVAVVLVRRKGQQPAPTPVGAPTNRYQEMFEQDLRDA